jgi:hypothetical protein
MTQPRPSHRRSLVTTLLVGATIGAVVLVGLRYALSAAPPASAGAVRPASEAPSLRPDAAGFRPFATAADGAPVRWNPCRPIDVVLSSAGLPAGGQELLEQGLARLNEASGLHLRLIGLTPEAPSVTRGLVERDGDAWRWAPVLIGWVSTGQSGLALPFEERGIALPVAVRGTRGHAFVTGQIALNADRTDLRMDFADRAESWGATLLHELGHLVGLDHVSDTAQLMSEAPGAGPVEFSAGDLDGLVAVGAAAGCLDVPDPQEGRGLSPAAAWAR